MFISLPDTVTKYPDPPPLEKSSVGENSSRAQSCQATGTQDCHSQEAKKQRGTKAMCSQPSSLYRSSAQGVLLLIFPEVLLTLIKVINIIPHSHTQRVNNLSQMCLVSQLLPDFVQSEFILSTTHSHSYFRLKKIA